MVVVETCDHDIGGGGQRLCANIFFSYFLGRHRHCSRPATALNYEHARVGVGVLVWAQHEDVLEREFPLMWGGLADSDIV